MRDAGNFNPEWGYLAPVPGFVRIVRIALAAAAIGASAGAAVVFSLVERPAAETSVSARTLVSSSEAVFSGGATAQSHIGASAPISLPSVSLDDSTAAAPHASSSGPGPAGVAALAETPASDDAAPVPPARGAVIVSDKAAAQKTAAKKSNLAARTDPRGEYARDVTRSPLAFLPSLGTRLIGMNPVWGQN
jgi:hypothetical protein